jgi:hypothetical protein
MATIGELAVNIVANTAGLARGIGDARKGVGAFVTRMRALPGVQAGINAIARGFDSVRASVEAALPAIDAVGKFSSRLGMMTEELIALRHAADLTGTSHEAINSGLERMTRRIADAANSSKTLRARMLAAGASLSEIAKQEEEVGGVSRALHKLGLDTQSMLANSPAKNFEQIADAMKTLPTRAEQVRVAFALFGRQGIQLINMLDLGSEGMSEMRKEAEELGISFSAIEAAKVEAANDAVDRMKKSFSGLGTQLAIVIAPSLQRIADIIRETTQTQLPQMKKLFGDMGVILEQNARNASGLAEALNPETSTGIIAQLQRPGRFIRDQIGGLIGADFAGGLQTDFADLPTQAEADRKREQEKLQRDQQLQEEVAAAAAAHEQRMAAITQRETALQEEKARIFEATRTPIEKFQQELKRLHFLFQQGLDIDTYNRAVGQAREAFDENARRFRESARRAFEASPAGRRQAELRSRAESLTESTRTPMEEFRRSIQELFELDQAGLIDPETFRRRRKEIFEGAKAGLPESQPTQFAGAALQGSQEAFSAILRAGAKDEQLAEQKRQTGLLAMMERHLVESLKRRPAVVPSLGGPS